MGAGIGPALIGDPPGVEQLAALVQHRLHSATLPFALRTRPPSSIFIPLLKIIRSPQKMLVR